jgi:mono/diheme cytochrome c family protein
MWTGSSWLLLSMLLVAAAPAAAGASPQEKYVLFCAGCHGYEGEGGGGGGGTRRIGPFVEKIGLFLKDREGRRYLVNVGGVSSAGMTDAETATVLNYIINTFGGRSRPADFVPYTVDEVTALRKVPVDDPAAMRTQIALRLRARGVGVPPGHWE